jgi:hypothetical protein
MLSFLSKRLCPLMSLALAFGCGKKINDPATSDLNRTEQTQTTELPAVLTIQLQEAAATFKTYQLTKNAWFNLPTKLNVRAGDATGKRVKIYYNLLSNGDYEFLCNYKSVSTPSQLNFENCLSSDQIQIVSNVNDLEKMDFPMDKGSSVKVQLTNPSAGGLVIDSTYRVDWK